MKKEYISPQIWCVLADASTLLAGSESSKITTSGGGSISIYNEDLTGGLTVEIIPVGDPEDSGSGGGSGYDPDDDDEETR